MASALRPAVAAGCVVLLLTVGAWTVGTLRNPDPRARGSWSGAPSGVSSTPLDVTLYLPGCPIGAIRIHAAPGQSGTLITEVRRAAEMGGDALAPMTRHAVAPGGSADVTLLVSPARERVRLHLAATDAGLELDAGRPFTLVRQSHSPLGLLPCIADGDVSQTWFLLALVGLHLTGFGWLAATVVVRRPAVGPNEPTPWDAKRGPMVAMGLVAPALILYLIVVPPFEPPDELAHLQYARYVAVTGHLPSDVPPHDSEWRSSVYEWVQQPAYYVVAARVLRATGYADAAPAPQAHPQSRLAGGADVSIFRHPDMRSPPRALRGLFTLRWLSVAMALAVVWCTARTVTLATGDGRLGAASAAALALVPQWTAVMGSVSTDPPATLAAAVTTLLICRLLKAPHHWRQSAVVGATIGLAYASKATSLFLVPMVLVALLHVARTHGFRTATRHAAACAAGVALTAAWIPVRAWLVFGDPLARAFKREVLAIGGFVVTEGPPLFSVAFADQLRLMVFEAFWARFGSLGAGPLPGSRIWWVYGATTCLLFALFLLGTWRAGRAYWRIQPKPLDATGARTSMLVVSVVGVLTGVMLWAWVNLVPQADVIVHWTPRHVLPLAAPLLVVVASGLQFMAHSLPAGFVPSLRSAVATGLVVLTVTGLAVLRSVVLGFHFGY